MKRARILLSAGTLACLLTSGLTAAHAFQKPGPSATWPTHGWAKGKLGDAGIDEKTVIAFDKDLASGKYGLVDSFGLFRCGKLVFENKYPHDYGQIYGKDAKVKGPLNARLTGPYNYFDPAWHPYYHGTDMHTMQSITKTVSSVILGAAITRGDFKAGLDTPLMHYFDASKVKNVDERKKRITLRHVLTMTTGMDWIEDVAYDDPRNEANLMEASEDWVQYVIDHPMVKEPGTVFNYSSGTSELLAYVFQKETGHDIEEYGEKYVFAPLGIKHYWKRSPMRVVDTEGGLYLSGADLAKIGYLYLHDGLWDGKQIVSKEWVKESLTPAIDAEEGFKYGYKWWLLPRTNGLGFVSMGQGFGGQRLMIFPEKDVIATFTAWSILNDPPSYVPEFVNRFVPSLKGERCPGQ
jgi:CubicO group peptidase (beta-lactamase class C family)